MSMMEEFKTFAVSGNVMDLAIGVVIGGAFGKIVNSLVNDIIMPPVSLLTSGVDFKNLFINLSGKEITNLAQAQKDGLAVLTYGNFIQTTIEFLIVAFTIFLVVKQINRFRGKEMTEAGK
nr:large conductance mechanosensitive channel protein MscL [Bryobacter aggregatus]